MRALNRRAEDQPRVLLFFFIVIVLAAVVATIVGVVVLASTNASKSVLSDQRDVSVYSQSIVQSHFSILSARYVDEETARCALGSEFTRPATLTVRFKTQLVPETCSLFVNGALLSSERRLEPECGRTCPFSEYNRQFSLRLNDYRDDHTVRVCCDDICVERTLQKLCSATTQS